MPVMARPNMATPNQPRAELGGQGPGEIDVIETGECRLGKHNHHQQQGTDEHETRCRDVVWIRKNTRDQQQNTNGTRDLTAWR
jgi:hypothetical protein